MYKKLKNINDQEKTGMWDQNSLVTEAKNNFIFKAFISELVPEIDSRGHHCSDMPLEVQIRE